jgi:hypothetical protein
MGQNNCFVNDDDYDDDHVDECRIKERNDQGHYRQQAKS